MERIGIWASWNSDHNYSGGIAVILQKEELKLKEQGSVVVKKVYKQVVTFLEKAITSAPPPNDKRKALVGQPWTSFTLTKTMKSRSTVCLIASQTVEQRWRISRGWWQFSLDDGMCGKWQSFVQGQTNWWDSDTGPEMWRNSATQSVGFSK